LPSPTSDWSGKSSTVAEEAQAEKPLSAWVLVAANVLPLVGVLFWDWDVFALLVLFWMENVVVGVFFIVRMMFADLEDAALWLGKLFMVLFFCVHYGMFTAVHGVFVFTLFGQVSGGWTGCARARRTRRGRLRPVGATCSAFCEPFLLLRLELPLPRRISQREAHQADGRAV
jgi:hypothetical protein